MSAIMTTMVKNDDEYDDDDDDHDEDVRVGMIMMILVRRPATASFVNCCSAKSSRMLS